MLLLIVILAVILLISLWSGYRQLFRIEQLNRKIVINSLVGAMVVLTLLSIAHGLGILSQPVAARITMGLYSAAAGFFFGYGIKLIVSKRKAGKVEYMYRSFWADIAPNLISILLVAYGLYRTGILTDDPFTGIGITSGLSLVGFGFFGWTIRLVPEFRSKGILILDQYIEWKKVLSYEWKHDGAVQIDYFSNGDKIYQFTTSIPADEQLQIERLLGKKIQEHEEERNEVIGKDEKEESP